MSKVALIKCESYHPEQVRKAVLRGLDLLGGIGQFVKKNETILLKPNLITGAKPERSVTTHPVVVEAVASLLMQYGAKVSAGDGPGVISSISAARNSGILKVAERLNIPWHDFKNFSRVEFKGSRFRVFDIATAVIEHQGLISLPKFKTHELTVLTGCVKNQYGCLSFADKRKYHALFPDIRDFSLLLLDLNKFINPRLYIVDGISALEGNGPLAGNPVRLNALILSGDPVAADIVMCKLIGLNPQYVPTVKLGQEYGYGAGPDNEPEIAGDDLSELINTRFKIGYVKTSQRRSGSIGTIAGLLTKKPVIIHSACTQCGDCSTACPAEPKAINNVQAGEKSKAVIDYDRCIRCFCCFEVCRYHAVKLYFPFYKRMLNKLLNLIPQ